MAGPEPLALSLQALNRCSERVGVLVDAENVEVRVGPENRPSMPATAEGGVHHRARRHVGEELE